jgi:hypothetical protein
MNEPPELGARIERVTSPACVHCCRLEYVTVYYPGMSVLEDVVSGFAGVVSRFAVVGILLHDPWLQAEYSIKLVGEKIVRFKCVSCAHVLS